ncbi:MAG: hypothetical protein RML56_06815 [Burkholderiales bacterium]|nr:hypothetical protein [Burkholderiales bacterium]
MEHFSRDEAIRFLDLCRAALKPGGRLILQTPNADSPFGSSIRYGDITHEWAFNVKSTDAASPSRRIHGNRGSRRGADSVGYSAASTLRFIVWRMLRTALQLWNLAETGATLPVLTRVFLVKGDKPNA